MNLLSKLYDVYPDWRKFHDTAEQAMVEVGLIDEEVVTDQEVPELDFNEDSYTEFETPESYYD